MRQIKPTPNSKNSHKSSLIAGRNPVRQLIEISPKRIIKLFVSDSKDRMDSLGQEIIELAKKNRVQMQVMPHHQMMNISRNPQGFIAEVTPKELLDLNGLEHLASQIDSGIIVAIDGVKDPQNLGSIMRACDCFGVAALVWSKNRSAPVTEVVSKVSAGASEFLPCAQVSNLRDALIRLRKLGFSSCVTAISDSATKLSEFKFQPRTVLVLGSEGDGVQPLILKEADNTVYVQQYGVVDSLNVGQAAAVFLFAFRAQYF